MLWGNKLGVLVLDLGVDVSKRRRDLDAWLDGEAQPMCLPWARVEILRGSAGRPANSLCPALLRTIIMIWVLSNDHHANLVEGRIFRPRVDVFGCCFARPVVKQPFLPAHPRSERRSSPAGNTFPFLLSLPDRTPSVHRKAFNAWKYSVRNSSCSSASQLSSIVSHSSWRRSRSETVRPA